MHLSTIAVAFAGIASYVSASPAPQSTQPTAAPTGCITAADLIKIAPSSSSCNGGDFADECATAQVAAPNINAAFHTFDIDSFGAQAAIVSIMIFESGSFKYNRNHFPAPGTPGQGTRNMQSADFNDKYATWIAENGHDESITTADVTDAQGQGAADVLALINASHKWSFGSAAWFLKNQCDASIATSLADGTQASYEKYLTECVGTTVTADRISGWQTVINLKGW